MYLTLEVRVQSNVFVGELCGCALINVEMMSGLLRARRQIVFGRVFLGKKGRGGQNFVQARERGGERS